jgi:hypothetical protein
MRRMLMLAATLAGLSFVLPAGARAGEQTLTFTSDPIADLLLAAPRADDTGCDGALIAGY